MVTSDTFLVVAHHRSFKIETIVPIRLQDSSLTCSTLYMYYIIIKYTPCVCVYRYDMVINIVICIS